MIPIDGEVMRSVAPHLTGPKAIKQGRIIDQIGPLLLDTLKRFEIDTQLRISHFLAQTCQESDCYSTTEEYASGDEYQGRLGNIHPGDGRRYKGRGILQLTGRSNYREYGHIVGLDLEGNPTIAAEPALSLQIACEFWRKNNINPDCDRNDLVAVTRKVNGGTHGIEQRRAFLTRARAVVARIVAFSMVDAKGRPILRRESLGEAVGKLQGMLRDLGFELTIDQDFGPATELAVMQFQKAHDLEVDGIVGTQTWDALEVATVRV
jgi:putative chitinase